MRAYRVAYDGRAYHGFQRQPAVSTVEDALLGTLAESGIDFEDTPPGWAAAGRTDAGVSALAQTVTFDAPEWLSPRAFTARLPEDIHVWASTPVPDDFHATHDANRREYTYFLENRSTDQDRVEALNDALSGVHDFHNLAAEDEGTVRDISVESRSEGQFRRITVEADGFPRQLVRRLVALYERVLWGGVDLAFVDRVLDPDPLPGPKGIKPAPAYPLVLTDVAYSQEFEIDESAVEMAREVLSDRVRQDRTRARVGTVLERGMQDRSGAAGDNA